MNGQNSCCSSHSAFPPSRVLSLSRAGVQNQASLWALAANIEVLQPADLRNTVGALYAKASDNAIFHAGAGPCGVELAVRWSAYYVLRVACILETRLESTERSDT